MASISKRLLVLPLLLAPLLLAGCEEKYQDWRDYNRLIVERSPVSLTLAVEDDTVVTVQDMTRLQPFVDTYFKRGEAPFTVVVSKDGAEGGEEKAKDQGAKMVELLTAMGVDGNDLKVLTTAATATSPAGMARLGYDVYTVKTKECGDWNDSSSFSPFRNDALPSFGCSVARNIGLMVDNPRDLVHPHALDGRDATRGATIIGKYRAGEDTVSKGAVTSSISSVGSSSK